VLHVGVVCGLCLITVDEDTRTVSLPELESIFVALRLMDADAVYQAKLVLVMIDVWKLCLYYSNSPRTSSVSRRPEKMESRQDREEAKQRKLKIWRELTG
jgi:hypothetical protein